MIVVSARLLSMGSPLLAPGIALVLSLACALPLGLVACGAEERALAPLPAPAPGGSTAAVSRAELPLPAPGAWSVEVSGAGVRVLANRAPRREVLRELAERAGFQLEVTEGAELPPLSSRIDGLSLDEALPIVVGALDYRVERLFDPTRAAHVVHRVTVGPEKPPRAEVALPPESVSPGWRRIEELRERLEPSLRLAEVFERLESYDPDARAAAVAELEPHEEELELLRAVLEDDPDPVVRIAAAEQLAGGESYGATQALLGTLADRDPEVVGAVVEALASSGDASVIPQLAPLLDHQEPGVRAAATLAIETLSD